jgi:hypothetical protein
MAPRDAFPGYDEPVNIDLEPEEALRVLLDAKQEESAEAEAEAETKDG